MAPRDVEGGREVLWLALTIWGGCHDCGGLLGRLWGDCCNGRAWRVFNKAVLAGCWRDGLDVGEGLELMGWLERRSIELLWCPAMWSS